MRALLKTRLLLAALALAAALVSFSGLFGQGGGGEDDGGGDTQFAWVSSSRHNGIG